MNAETTIDDQPKQFGIYIQNEQGEWVVNPEFDKQANAMYYRDRLIYDTRDHRLAVGRYNEFGDLVNFNRWHDEVSKKQSS